MIVINIEKEKIQWKPVQTKTGVRHFANLVVDNLKETDEKENTHSVYNNQSKEDRAESRRLNVRIRQPGVKGHQSGLHREGEEEAEHDPPGDLRIEAARGLQQLAHVPRQNCAWDRARRHAPSCVG